MRVSRNKNLFTYSKVLFGISIALLIYGLILDYTTDYGLIDPVKDVDVIHSDSTNINISTSDKDDINSVQNNISDDTTVNNISETDNNNLRSEIEKKYSIKVVYGDETEGYTVSGIGTKKMTDAVKINEQLNKLNNALSKYPRSLFREIKKGGIPLTIFLINSYEEINITGITDSNYNYANISIAAIHPFEESFYHESYHYIERYLFKKGASYNSWDSLNPSGFNWGTIDSKLSYNMTNIDTAPFVNNYAQSSAEEDRASIFEYMMSDVEATCFRNRNNTIWLKANYMAMTMESTLDSISPNYVEHWEKWLKND